MTDRPTTGMHPLDHLVLPTGSLDTARARLTSLGFVVAPTGIHPFGTENCCVFLADGTYLEPLAIGSEQAAIDAAAGGNVFVARDRLYRDSLGDEGFSAVVLGTDNADTDHARYVEAGLSAGDTLSFSRAFMDTAGKSDVASFKLAFAATHGATDAFLFACQRINAFPADRKALETHANGVTGISEIALSAEDPQAFAEFLETASGGAEPREAALGLSFELPNGKLSIFSNEGMEAYFDAEPLVTDNGLRARAIVCSPSHCAKASSSTPASEAKSQ